MFLDHEKTFDELPRITFRKNREKIEIGFASFALSGAEWEKRIKNPDIFRRAVFEVIDALALMRQRVKKTDAFDLEAFLSHCEAKGKAVPAEDEELLKLVEHLRDADIKRRLEMSPWDKLGIEWRDYYPDARKILDDVFFWDCADDFAPHGNDTGADLLHEYKEWHGHADENADPIAHFQDWLYSADELPVNAPGEPPDQAAIALAFAEIKLRGECRPSVTALAREAIQRQRAAAADLDGWPHAGELLRRLDQMEAKLS